MEGIDALGKRSVVLVWDGAEDFQLHAPGEYATAIGLFQELTATLGQEAYTGGRPTEVCVYVTE